jgi:hypothetical protein
MLVVFVQLSLKKILNTALRTTKQFCVRIAPRGGWPGKKLHNIYSEIFPHIYSNFYKY